MQEKSTHTKPQAAEDQVEQTRRRPYRSPRLEDLGGVEDLTRTSTVLSGLDTDGGQTFPNVYADLSGG